MTSPTFTRAGDPTDETLAAIEHWPGNDPRGWLQFCRDTWGVEYGRATLLDGQLELITGGWSANEDTVYAMQRNTMLWLLCWQLSERGGRFVFEEPARG